MIQLECAHGKRACNKPRDVQGITSKIVNQLRNQHKCLDSLGELAACKPAYIRCERMCAPTRGAFTACSPFVNAK
jgi:hypothetical protein